jgi:large subunit ribosomal protein L7/L12
MIDLIWCDASIRERLELMDKARGTLAERLNAYLEMPGSGGNFEVVSDAIGPNEINVIEVVCAATGLGLTETKDTVEAAPKTIKDGLTHEEA